MPRPHPREFRQRVAELARLGDKPVSEIANDFGISNSCLAAGSNRPTSTRAAVRCSYAKHQELVTLRRETRTLRLENELLKRAAAHFGTGERPPKMTYAFIAERCSDLPVAAWCRVMKVSTSKF